MLHEHASVLSQMIYKDNCTGEVLTNFVSPLAGVLRDPRPVCGDRYAPNKDVWRQRGVQPWVEDWQNKEYIILDPSYLARAREAVTPPQGPTGPRSLNRAFLFDAGSTVYDDNTMTGIRWLIDRFLDAGITFDGVSAINGASAYGKQSRVSDMMLQTLVNGVDLSHLMLMKSLKCITGRRFMLGR